MPRGGSSASSSVCQQTSFSALNNLGNNNVQLQQGGNGIKNNFRLFHQNGGFASCGVNSSTTSQYTPPIPPLSIPQGNNSYNYAGNSDPTNLLPAINKVFMFPENIQSNFTPALTGGAGPWRIIPSPALDKYRSVQKDKKKSKSKSTRKNDKK